MKVFALELEYEDDTGETHHELRGLFNSRDDATWNWTYHVSDFEKTTYKNYKISKWDLED